MQSTRGKMEFVDKVRQLVNGGQIKEKQALSWLDNEGSSRFIFTASDADH